MKCNFWEDCCSYKTQKLGLLSTTSSSIMDERPASNPIDKQATPDIP